MFVFISKGVKNRSKDGKKKHPLWITKIRRESHVPDQQKA